MGRRTLENNQSEMIVTSFDEVLGQVIPKITGFEVNRAGNLIVPTPYRINLVAHNDSPQEDEDSSEVNGKMLKTVIDELEEARFVSSRHVEITLSTNGGRAYAASGIVDAIDLFKHKTKAVVTIIGLGLVASAGTYIMQAASPGERVLLENSTFMMHPMISGDYPTETPRREAGLKATKRLRQVLWKKMAKRTGLDIGQIRKLEDANHLTGSYLSATEAKKKGMVDQVIKLS